MVPEIYRFDFSLEDWRKYLKEILQGCDCPCKDINEIWASHLECVIEPGFNAVWVLSEASCEVYNLLYPTSVIVKVSL